MAKQVKDTKTEEVKTETPKTETTKTEEVKTEEVKTEEVKTETPKTEEVKTETPETIITETFDKVTEKTDKKLEEESNENEEYSLLNLEEGDAHLAVESIVEEEKLDLSKDSVQLAMKKDEDTIYYRFNKNSSEWTDWKIYAKIEIIEESSLEGIDAEIEKILSEEHYFNFVSAGRFIIDGKYSEKDLENFYKEFKSSEILFNKNHYDLLDLLNKKFK